MPLLDSLLRKTPNWEMLIRNAGWGIVTFLVLTLLEIQITDKAIFLEEESANV